MDETEFWDLVSQSHAGTGGDPQSQAEALYELLTRLPKAELADFARTYEVHHARAYRWDVWAAGVVIKHGMNEDAFDTFRDWLISRGRAVFERALQDPDSLADVPDVGNRTVNAESFGGAVHRVFEDVHGEETPVFETAAPGWPPAGTPWKGDTYDEIAEGLPRLSAIYRSRS
jgi:hypothetical protein